MGASCVVHGHRAAREDDGAHAAAFELGHRRVVGQELGVDVQLAHATRDQLGELAAEVEDGDGRGPGRGRGDRRPVLGCARRRRRVERNLEIGLDLGVVGCEHPVAGVGRLTVDGLPALPGRLRRGPGCGLLLLGRVGQRPLPMRAPMASAKSSRPSRAGGGSEDAKARPAAPGWEEGDRPLHRRRLVFDCSSVVLQLSDASVLGAVGPAPRAFVVSTMRLRPSRSHRQAWRISADT